MRCSPARPLGRILSFFFLFSFFVCASLMKPPRRIWCLILACLPLSSKVLKSSRYSFFFFFTDFGLFCCGMTAVHTVVLLHINLSLPRLLSLASVSIALTPTAVNIFNQECVQWGMLYSGVPRVSLLLLLLLRRSIVQEHSLFWRRKVPTGILISSFSVSTVDLQYYGGP